MLTGSYLTSLNSILQPTLSQSEFCQSYGLQLTISYNYLHRVQHVQSHGGLLMKNHTRKRPSHSKHSGYVSRSGLTVHWTMAQRTHCSKLIFHTLTLSYQTHIFNIKGKTYSWTVQWILLAFESALPEKKPPQLSLADHKFISTQKDCVWKFHLNKDIDRRTPTSFKGRHSLDTETNAESFEWGYFP